MSMNWQCLYGSGLAMFDQDPDLITTRSSPKAIYGYDIAYPLEWAKRLENMARGRGSSATPNYRYAINNNRIHTGHVAAFRECMPLAAHYYNVATRFVAELPQVGAFRTFNSSDHIAAYDAICTLTPDISFTLATPDVSPGDPISLAVPEGMLADIQQYNNRYVANNEHSWSYSRRPTLQVTQYGTVNVNRTGTLTDMRSTSTHLEFAGNMVQDRSVVAIWMNTFDGNSTGVALVVDTLEINLQNLLSQIEATGTVPSHPTGITYSCNATAVLYAGPTIAEDS